MIEEVAETEDAISECLIVGRIGNVSPLLQIPLEGGEVE